MIQALIPLISSQLVGFGWHLAIQSWRENSGLGRFSRAFPPPLVMISTGFSSVLLFLQQTHNNWIAKVKFLLKGLPNF